MKISKEDLQRIDKAIKLGAEQDLINYSQMLYVRAIALCLREIVAREYR